MNKLTELYKHIDYQFTEPKLLEQALCHRSIGKNNNERLEFLGDGILNFIIGAELYKKYPKATEGELSRLRATLVKGETLTKIGRQFSLNQFIKLGLGEQKSGGANRSSILSDAVEAIIGAIYLDSDFQTCQNIVLKWFQERLQRLNDPESLKDPKTRLQEYLQSRKFPLPDYEIIATQGQAHKQEFHISCTVKGLKLKALGKGMSRRKAEQAAAANFFELLNYDN